MACFKLLLVCLVGFTFAQQSQHDKWSSFISKVGETLSHGRDNGDSHCDHEDRKNHAIALLKEWVKHHHYDAVEKLYHDIYHHDLTPQKRQWHHYDSTFDEAFKNGNKDPDYFHVENYVKYYMNQACRTELMKWIEHLAKTHTPTHTHAPTNAPSTHAPHTHAPHTHAPTTPAPTTHAPTTQKPTTQAATTPAPSIITQITVKSQCEAVTFVTALARGTKLTNSGAGLCTDGTNSRPEALVLESCNTPTVATWKQGVKVMGNCKSIPDYTPIGMFSFGTFVQDGSAITGIITECTTTGFKIAIQLCGHPVNVYELISGAKDPQQNADNYYVIDW